MITVEMVRDKGFEFVAQDVINVSYPENEPDYQIIENRFLCVVNDKTPPWDDCDVKEFAWRDNKGEMPCDGELWVEVEFRDGEKFISIASGLGWVISNNSKGDIIKWRPSFKNWESEMNLDKIETQEEKEAFDVMVQDNEMVQNHEIGKDSGIHNDLDWEGVELPPVGVECEMKYKHASQAAWRKCKVFAYSNEFGVIAAIWHFDDEWKHATISVDQYEFRKQETPEQKAERDRMENGKAIYDLMSSIEMNHDIAGTPNTWSELRDEWQSVYIQLAESVGYRKQNG